MTKGAATDLYDFRQQDNVLSCEDSCVLRAASNSLQNSMEKTFGESGLGEETFQKFLHTCWNSQEALGENFEAWWNSANPGVPAGHVLDLYSKARISYLTACLAEVEANEIILKLQKPLLTIW